MDLWVSHLRVYAPGMQLHISCIHRRSTHWAARLLDKGNTTDMTWLLVVIVKVQHTTMITDKGPDVVTVETTVTTK